MLLLSALANPVVVFPEDAVFLQEGEFEVFLPEEVNGAMFYSAFH